MRAKNYGIRSIAREIGRSPSTVSRELRRNAATWAGKLDYRASVAQWKADLVAQRPKPCKLVENPRLREYVQDRLAGVVHDGNRDIAGPAGSALIGRNRPHRGIGAGFEVGAPNRSRSGFGSISSMMRP